MSDTAPRPSAVLEVRIVDGETWVRLKDLDELIHQDSGAEHDKICWYYHHPCAVIHALQLEQRVKQLESERKDLFRHIHGAHEILTRIE